MRGKVGHGGQPRRTERVYRNARTPMQWGLGMGIAERPHGIGCNTNTCWEWGGVGSVHSPPVPCTPDHLSTRLSSPSSLLGSPPVCRCSRSPTTRCCPRRWSAGPCRSSRSCCRATCRSSTTSTGASCRRWGGDGEVALRGQGAAVAATAATGGGSRRTGPACCVCAGDECPS